MVYIGMYSQHHFTVWGNIFIYQLFRERLSKKAQATIPKGIVGSFKLTVLDFSISEKSEKMTRDATELCLRVLKGTYLAEHIPDYISGLSRAFFSDNVSRNSCMQGTE